MRLVLICVDCGWTRRVRVPAVRCYCDGAGWDSVDRITPRPGAEDDAENAERGRIILWPVVAKDDPEATGNDDQTDDEVRHFSKRDGETGHNLRPSPPA